MDQRGRGAELGKDGRDVHGAPFVSANCIRFDEFDLSPFRWGTPAFWKVSRSSGEGGDVTIPNAGVHKKLRFN